MSYKRSLLLLLIYDLLSKYVPYMAEIQEKAVIRICNIFGMFAT